MCYVSADLVHNAVKMTSTPSATKQRHTEAKVKLTRK